MLMVVAAAPLGCLLLVLFVARCLTEGMPQQQRFDRYLRFYEGRHSDWCGQAPETAYDQRLYAYVSGEHTLLRLLSPQMWLPLLLLNRTDQLTILLCTLQLKCAVAVLLLLPGLLPIQGLLLLIAAIVCASAVSLPFKFALDTLFERRGRARGWLPTSEGRALVGNLKAMQIMQVLERHVQARALLTHVDARHAVRAALFHWARNARIKAQLDETAGLIHSKHALLAWKANAAALGEVLARQRLKVQKLQSWALARPATLVRFAETLGERMRPLTVRLRDAMPLRQPQLRVLGQRMHAKLTHTEAERMGLLPVAQRALLIIGGRWALARWCDAVAVMRAEGWARRESRRSELAQRTAATARRCARVLAVWWAWWEWVEAATLIEQAAIKEAQVKEQLAQWKIQEGIEDSSDDDDVPSSSNTQRSEGVGAPTAPHSPVRPSIACTEQAVNAHDARRARTEQRRATERSTRASRRSSACSRSSWASDTGTERTMEGDPAWDVESAGEEDEGQPSSQRLIEWNHVSALDPFGVMEDEEKMAALRFQVEADHPPVPGRQTYLRAPTVTVARPVGALLQTVELMSALQRGEAPHTARSMHHRVTSSVPRGSVSPRLKSLRTRRERVMGVLSQLHGAESPLQGLLVSQLRKDMRALQRERLELLQLAALRPNLTKIRRGVVGSKRPKAPSTLPQVALLELDGLLRDTEAAARVLVVEREAALREQEQQRQATERSKKRQPWRVPGRSEGAGDMPGSSPQVSLEDTAQETSEANAADDTKEEGGHLVEALRGKVEEAKFGAVAEKLARSTRLHALLQQRAALQQLLDTLYKKMESRANKSAAAEPLDGGGGTTGRSSVGGATPRGDNDDRSSKRSTGVPQVGGASGGNRAAIEPQLPSLSQEDLAALQAAAAASGGAASVGGASKMFGDDDGEAVAAALDHVNHQIRGMLDDAADGLGLEPLPKVEKGNAHAMSEVRFDRAPTTSFFSEDGVEAAVMRAQTKERIVADEKGAEAAAFGTARRGGWMFPSLEDMKPAAKKAGSEGWNLAGPQAAPNEAPPVPGASVGATHCPATSKPRQCEDESEVDQPVLFFGSRTLARTIRGPPSAEALTRWRPNPQQIAKLRLQRAEELLIEHGIDTTLGGKQAYNTSGKHERLDKHLGNARCQKRAAARGQGASAAAALAAVAAEARQANALREANETRENVAASHKRCRGSLKRSMPSARVRRSGGAASVAEAASGLRRSKSRERARVSGAITSTSDLGTCSGIGDGDSRIAPVGSVQNKLIAMPSAADPVAHEVRKLRVTSHAIGLELQEVQQERREAAARLESLAAGGRKMFSGMSRQLRELEAMELEERGRQLDAKAAHLVVAFLAQSSKESGVKSAQVAASRMDAQVQQLLHDHAASAGFEFEIAPRPSSGEAGGQLLRAGSKWRNANMAMQEYRTQKQEDTVILQAQPLAAAKVKRLQRSLWLPWAAVLFLMLMGGGISAYLGLATAGTTWNLEWVLVVGVSLMVDWLVLEPALAMRHDKEHVRERNKWQEIREKHAAQGRATRAAWRAFMRARRVRRVGEEVVAREEQLAASGQRALVPLEQAHGDSKKWEGPAELLQ